MCLCSVIHSVFDMYQTTGSSKQPIRTRFLRSRDWLSANQGRDQYFLVRSVPDMYQPIWVIQGYIMCISTCVYVSEKQTGENLFNQDPEAVGAWGQARRERGRERETEGGR